MSIPAADTAVPDAVRALAKGSPLIPLWLNGLGGVTFRTDDGRVIKFGPLHHETSMANEAERMRWAAPYVRVPTVLEQGDDGVHEWLVTVLLRGESAVAPEWIARPEIAVRAVGAGLRALHDALPVDACPFEWSVAARIANARERGIVVPERFDTPPEASRLVVCHGDACCPNTLLDSEGEPLAYIDLGALGVADRWADIAVASMSTAWNYGESWEDALIDAYGIEPDRERLAFYRDLWDAT